jgi:hypothetical protein
VRRPRFAPFSSQFRLKRIRRCALEVFALSAVQILSPVYSTPRLTTLRQRQVHDLKYPLPEPPAQLSPSPAHAFSLNRITQHQQYLGSLSHIHALS